jgi:hypothetical protein
VDNVGQSGQGRWNDLLGMISDHTRAVKHFHLFERIPAHVLPKPAAAERNIERDISLGIFAGIDEFMLFLST